MKRRDVIKLGAVAAGAGLGIPGCGLPRMIATMEGPDGAAAFDAMIEEQLAALERPGMLQRLVSARTQRELSPEADAKIAAHDAMFRRMLGTLLVTQGFRDLPEATQQQPVVQARMHRHIDEIDGNVFAVTDMLATLPAHQRAHVGKQLRDQPDLPMDLGEALDERSERAGISGARRRQLRSMMMQASFRLKNGDAGVIIDECVNKVERLKGTTTQDAEARALAEKLGEREFWRYQHLVADDDASGGQAPAPAAPPAPAPPADASGGIPPVPPVDPAAQAARERVERLHLAARQAAAAHDCRLVDMIGGRIFSVDRAYHAGVFLRDPSILECLAALPPVELPARIIPGPHPGSGGLHIGGYLLGVSLATGAASALLIAADSNGPGVVVGVFGLTAAVLLFAIALLVLLVSALVYALED